MILTISDGINNGKGGNNYVTFDRHCYIYDCQFINDKLYINNNILNIQNITIVFFNFNEDLFTYKLVWDKKLKKRFKHIGEYILLYQRISNHLQKYNKKIIVYQNPNKCFDLGCKIKVYDKLFKIENTFVKIPQYIKINSIDDIQKITFYPVIIKISNGSNNNKDTLCKDQNQLINAYNSKFKNTSDILCIEFINSYIKCLNNYVCTRLLVINNKINQLYAKPNHHWNIHTDINKEYKIGRAHV